jgi:hypothetical protein
MNLKLCSIVLHPLVLACMAGAGPQLTSPAPVVEAKLSSILACKGRSHTIVGVKFGPAKDQLAFLVRHEAFLGNHQLHLVVASARLENPILLGNVAESAWRNDDRVGLPPEDSAYRVHVAAGPHLIQWSPDGSVVAAEGIDGVTLFQATGGGQCKIPIRDSSAVVGFSSGPTLLIDTRDHGEHTLHSYNADCRSVGTVPLPGEWPSAMVSIDGATLAFPGPKSIWITDAHGEDPREIRIDWVGGSADAPMFRYTESGRVLCVSCGGVTRCYNTISARRAGIVPEDEPRWMADASARSSRIVFRGYPVRQWSSSLTAAMSGHGGVENRHREFTVWDYGSGEDAMRVYKSAWSGEDGIEPVYALSPAGNLLVRAKGSTIRVYELPSDLNKGQE